MALKCSIPAGSQNGTWCAAARLPNAPEPPPPPEPCPEIRVAYSPKLCYYVGVFVALLSPLDSFHEAAGPTRQPFLL